MYNRPLLHVHVYLQVEYLHTYRMLTSESTVMTIFYTIITASLYVNTSLKLDEDKNSR